MNTTERLARLANRRTAYEIAAVHRDGRRLLIAYAVRRNRQGLAAALTSNPERSAAIVRVCGADSFNVAAKGAAATVGEWAIHFTGRTQREAIQSGELPFVMDV